MGAFETFTSLRQQIHNSYSSWITYLFLREIKEDGHPDKIVIYVNELFFTGIGVSSQTQSIIAIYNLFVATDKTHNLKSLLECSHTEGLLSDGVIQQCEQKLRDVSGMIKSVVILRNNIFAHSGKSDTQNLFDRADLSIKQTEQLYQVAFEILTAVAEAFNTSVYDPKMIEAQVLRSNYEVVKSLKNQASFQSV